MTVLDGVGERLGDDEVRGRLDRRGDAAAGLDGHRRRQLRARRERADRLGEAALGEQGRAHPAGEVAQLGERELRLVARLLDELARAVGVALEALLGHPEVQRERDEPRLRAVVQVALDALELGRGGVDGARAGLGQDLDALGELLGVGPEQEPRERARAGGGAAQQADRDRQRDDAGGEEQHGPPPGVDVDPGDLDRVGRQREPERHGQAGDRPRPAARPRR